MERKIFVKFETVLGWHGETHKWIECDNVGEVGTFYEIKEEGTLNG